MSKSQGQSGSLPVAEVLIKLCHPLKHSENVQASNNIPQCDETRPTCLKCQRYGHKCEYRDQFDILVRDQTKEASKRARQKWRARSTQVHRHDHSESERGSPMQNYSTPLQAPNTFIKIPYVSLSPPVAPLLSELALNRFYFDYVCSTKGGTEVRGFLSFLPKMVAKSSAGSLLHTSVMAVALANFHGRHRSSNLSDTNSGRIEYGKALLLTKSSLESRSQETETLLSVYLLSLYEVVQFPKHSRGSWLAHAGGAGALLLMQSENSISQSERSLSISYQIAWSLVSFLPTSRRHQ